MKRFMTLVAALLLLGAMTVTASAAGGISATNALGKAGQTVNITISLDEAVKGDQVLVEYSFDTSHLTAQPKQSKWSIDGSLNDFHNIKYIGTWASEKSTELKGELCTLSFLVKPGVSFDSTKVSCTITVALEGKQVGTYSTTAQVVTSCTHSYGLWESVGDLSHVRKCIVCGDKQSQIHVWDGGSLTADPDNHNNALMVHTCTVCRGTRSYVMENTKVPSTDPEQSQPTQPSQPSQPTQPSRPTQPSQPGPSQPTDPFTGEPIGDQGGNTGSSSGGNSGNQGGHMQETDPFTGQIIGGQETQPQQTNPYHDYNAPEHTHPQNTAPNYIEHNHDHAAEGSEATPYVLAAAAAVLLVVLVFFVKKKW